METQKPLFTTINITNLPDDLQTQIANVICRCMREIKTAVFFMEYNSWHSHSIIAKVVAHQAAYVSTDALACRDLFLYIYYRPPHTTKYTLYADVIAVDFIEFTYGLLPDEEEITILKQLNMLDIIEPTYGDIPRGPTLHLNEQEYMAFMRLRGYIKQRER